MAVYKRDFILSSGIGLSAEKIYITSATNSTTISTGSLVIPGGAGIAKSLSIGGSIQLFNGSFYTSLVSTATGNTVYRLPASSPAIGSSVLQSDSAGTLSWVPMVASGSGSAGSGTVDNGTIHAIPYYYASGTAITGSSSFTNVGTGITILYTTPSVSSTTGALVVYGGVGIGGSLFINGDITVNGTTTTINSVTLTVDDKNIEIGSVNTPSDITAEGGGITLKGATDKIINWYSGTGWSTNESWNLTQNSNYKISNTSVLSSSSLGVGVTNSYLTSVGTISTGVWSATAITSFYGGTGYQTYSTGDILVGAGATLYKLPVGSNNFVLTADNTAPGGIKWAASSAVASTGITSLNAITATIQYFASGTNGSGFNISSSGSTHTFNIPIAGTGATGLVSTLAQSFAGIKTFTNDVIVSSTTGSTAFNTGALTVYGGLGVSGQLSFNQAALGYTGATNPSIAFIGSTTSAPITLTVLSDNSLLWEGTSGKLFGINNNLSSGWIFNVGDISGLPIIRANADGTIAMAEFAANVGIGLSNPSYKLHVAGDANLSSSYVYRINGTQVLSANSLGTGITNSSLTAVGTLSTGVWSATAITALYGGTGLVPSFTVGDILYANTSNTWGRLTANSNVGYVLASAGSGATPTYVAQSTLSVGAATTATYSNQSGYAITSGIATTAVNLNTVATSANTTHYLLFSLANGGSGVAVSSDAGLFFNPASNTLTTNVFTAGVSVNSVIVNVTGSTASTSPSTGALVVTGGVGIGGSLYVDGDLTINGTTTTINSVTLTVDDKNIELGSVSVPSDVTAQTGGITLRGGTDKSILWYSGVGWSSSESWNLGSGNTYKIGSGIVLSSSSLGIGITNSSLTALGTISTGTWSATAITAFYGGTGFQTYSTGDLLVGAGTTIINLGVGTDGYFLTADSTKSSGLAWTTISTSAASGFTTLNNLTAGIQYFDTGTSGSGFNISSSGSTHTFNIPIAGSATTGLVSTLAQTIAGQKTFTSAILGDLTGTATTATYAHQSGYAITSGSSSFANTATYAHQSGYAITSGSSDISGFATTAANINLVNASTDSAHPMLFSPLASGSGVAVSSDSTISYNPSTNILSTSGLAVTANTASTNSSSGALIVSGGVGIGGSLYVAGDLTINGTTTTINSVTLTVDDKNIELGSVTSPSEATAEGGGFTLKGSNDKILNWYAGTGWSSNQPWNLSSGNTYKINNTDVLSSSSLGTGVTNSSLTALGTINTGIWAGTLITALYGGTGYNSYTKGDLLVGAGNTIIKLPAGNDLTILSANSNAGSGLSWKALLSPTYGAFGSTATQLVTGANTETLINFNTTYEANNVLIGSGTTTRVYINDSGVYNIQFSAQVDLADGSQPKQFDLWFKIDGVNVPNSNSRQTIAGKDEETILSLNFVSTFISGQYVELAFSSPDANLQLASFSGITTPTRPDIPSVILTVTPVSSILPGSGLAITGLASLNLLTSNAQTLVTGTSGSDFNISSIGSVHTFNIPSASSSARGLITNSTQTIGGIKTFANDVVMNSNNPSTSSTTGTLTVIGGVGIGGSLYVSSATGISGVLINNGVVTGSLIGTATTSASVNVVLAATNANHPLLFTPIVGSASGVAVSSNNTLVYNPATDILSVSGFAVTSLTASISFSSGAFTVAGGVGIGGSLYVSSATAISGVSINNGVITGNLTGTATSAGYATSSGIAITATNVNISSGNTNANHPVLFTPTTGSASGVAISSNSTLVYNPVANILSVSGLAITSGTASSNTTTGALVVRGGLGVSGQLSFAQASFGFTGITSNPTMAFIGATTVPYISLSVLTDNSLNFEGSSGSLFSIDNNLSSGDIFSVSDISGLPIISASAGQTVSINEFGGYTQIGNGSINSSSTSNGSLVIAGGLGITGNANIGGTVRITNSTSSTSSSSGSLSVSGGLGLAGNAFIGGTVNVTNNTVGSGVSSAALVVAGGLGVNGNVWVAQEANSKLSIMQSNGDEGGEIFLNKPTTNTSITTGVTIDIFQNRLRFFEQGGSARGFYLDITTGGNGVGTNIMGGSSSGTVNSGTATFAAYYPASSNTVSENANLQFTGTGVSIGGNIASTSTSSGSLKVFGGVGIGGTVCIDGVIKLGTDTFTKNYSQGDILLDNGNTDTPAIRYYWANNKNFGTDVFSAGAGSTKYRIVKELNETGGTELFSVDTTGAIQIYNGANYSGFKFTGSGSTIYTLPSSAPATGTSYLTSNSSGVMSWTPPSKTNYVLSFGAGFTPAANSADSVSLNVPFAPDGTTKYYFIKRVEYRNETLSGGTGLSFYIQRHTSGNVSWTTTNTITAGSGASFEVGAAVYATSFTTINSSAGIAGSIVSGDYVRLYFTTVGSAANVSIAITIEEQ